MQKRGQFYIIAAAIIIVVILGLATVANKALVQPKHAGFFDLSEDYDAETSKVIDYGIYNKYTPPIDITKVVENISNVFKETAFTKDPNVYLVFIYGNKTSYTAREVPIANYDTTFYYGESESTVQTAYQQEKNLTAIDGIINVKDPSGNDYQFNLTDDENFYFIIQTTSPSGEKNVVIRE